MKSPKQLHLFGNPPASARACPCGCGQNLGHLAKRYLVCRDAWIQVPLADKEALMDTYSLDTRRAAARRILEFARSLAAQRKLSPINP